MNETTKASLRRNKDPFFYEKVFVGCGIDIGCGSDILKKDYGFPLIEGVVPFDLSDGDAQHINNFRPNSYYDFVHSSQCLEHMVDARVAIVNWFKLVKPNGYMVITIPDEDLYEQGIWPSRWNNDHKWTFSIYKPVSWSPVHINVLDLVKSLGLSCEPIRLNLIDTNYNYSLMGKNIDQTRSNDGVEAFIELVVKKRFTLKYN